MITGIGDQAFVTAFLDQDDIEEAQATYEKLQKAEKSGDKKAIRKHERALKRFQREQLAAVERLIEADSVENGGTGALEKWFDKIVNLDKTSDQYLSVMSDADAIRELQSGVGSDFYEKYNRYGRAWFMTQFGPSSTDLDVQSYKDQAERDIRSQLVALGVNPDSVDYEGFIDQYYLNGFQARENRELFTQALVTQFGSGPGERVNYGDELRKSALENGVRYDDVWFQNAENRIAQGDASLEMYEDDFRSQAASRYPLFSKKLMAGENLWDISSPWRQTIQDVLEYTPTDIFDPNLAYAMEGTMGDDGTPGAMTLYDFKKYLRNQPEWEQTVNGRRTIDNTLADLATMFGVGF